ncbi:arid/bright DNA binding domain-containing protein [Diplocarpon rosae]|nr:arid/bright DNA binding domain-containing protein [Diplocarpon rosae]
MASALIVSSIDRSDSRRTDLLGPYHARRDFHAPAGPSLLEAFYARGSTADTSSVIPSKRPRPREESLGTSPRQASGMLPNSRSQTPSQPQYPGGFPQNNGTPQHAPQQIPYAHLQNGSANASPSPILRTGGVPQRVSTASPHPFSPAVQQFPHASPSQSEQGRADTPGNGNPYAQNSGYAQGFAQNFTPVPGRTSAPPQSGTPQIQPPHSQPPQMYQQSQAQPQPGQPRPQNALEQQKMLYQQMQMQQQMQQRNMMAARQGNLPPGAGPMAKGPLQMPNGQFAGMRPQQPPPPPAHAAQQLRAHYERNLGLFEEAWVVNQQRHRAAMMQQNPNVAQQMSPTKQMNPQAMQQSPNFLQPQQVPPHHLQHQRDAQPTPAKQTHNAQQPSVNGFATPQQSQGPHPVAQQSHTRNSMSRSVNVTPPDNSPAFAMLSPGQGTKSGHILAAQSDARGESLPPILTPVNLPDMLEPKARVVDSYGGYELLSLANLGDTLKNVRPDFPKVDELGAMGTIDIHALTMSLQCGIHSEVRLALDTLTALTMSNARLDMRQCEDLVETIIDCAEVQIELLAENAAEVSDVMLISSYEDIARGCRFDHQGLRELPAFGSPEYELDRSVDRLICLTTILRNLSFEEVNHAILADELVIKFLCVVIRYLGTRNMLLRTNQNTMDFMKDVITFLSNLAQSIELPGREQALCLIHFLLAFAPCPPPNTMGAESAVAFSSYDPAVHIYLPCAVDTLAKLLARDEPNRRHYKTIFASDVASLPPFDLLTRTFGLAISTIPDEKPDSKLGSSSLPVTESRKPSLMQGMLAAEILSNLAPGYETGIAKSWLTSEDGFSHKLGRLIVSLCLEAPPHTQHQRAPAFPKGADDDSLLHIIMCGIVVLQRLADKSTDPEDASSTIPLSGLPSKDSLLGALRVAHPRLQGVLRQLCAYSGLGI